MIFLRTLYGAWLLAMGCLSAASLTTGEWFIDLDPGEGEGTKIPGVSGTESAQDIVIQPATIGALSDGPHLLGIRFQDDSGAWGQVSWRLFLVARPVGDLVQGEYFFNIDPGEGSATPLAGADGHTVTLDPTLSLESLSPGVNLIGVRFQNSAGQWGQVTHRIFLNPEASQSPLNRVEFALFRDGTEISSGSLLGDGSLMIDLAQVPLAFTPNAGDSLILQLQAIDESGKEGHKFSREIAVKEFTESFLDLFFSSAEQSDPSTSGDLADVDKDGISNLLEQATGLHPREFNPAEKATGLDTHSATGKTFRFQAAAEAIFDAPSSTFALGDLRFEIENSVDAKIWSRALSPADFTISAENGANADGSFTHILELQNEPGVKKFYRLKVTRQ